MALTYTKNRYQNADGLTQYFPDAAGTSSRGGEVKQFASHETKVNVTLSALPVLSSDANGLLLADNARIPAGAFIDKVVVKVLKETAGANANFNLGIVNASTLAITDADGLLAAADAFNGGTDLGSITVYGNAGSSGASQSTEVGALVGTRLAATSLLCGSYDTAAFTDGIVEITVHWTIALSTDV